MLDVMEGTIRHRLLVNYAADPEVVTPLVPEPFRPLVVEGRAVVGICVLRLTELRPHGLPRRVGVASDNAAHRIAVEWDGPAGTEVGVHVLRRDTAQRLPALVGGRLFPGVHGRARFTVRDAPDELRVAYVTSDGLEVSAIATTAEPWASRVFETPADASAFFEAGDRGWSPDRHGDLEGIAMSTTAWVAEPVDIDAHASFYDDPARFPAGSIELDNALLMRDIPVTWRRIAQPEVGGMAAPNRSTGAPNLRDAIGRSL
jgi:hypothetical protein